AVNSRSYRLDLHNQMPQTHPIFHMSLLEPYHANEIQGHTLPPPPAVEIEGYDEYEVEAILDS
ncbi:hypothetical protein BGZ97_009726, partial [Linnemannia gamsii]